jgi:hypothetical protein
VGNIQIRVGREQNYPSLEGDGKETISDGYVELLVVAGFVTTNVLHLPLVEIIFSTLLGIKILFTAYEVGVKDGLVGVWNVFTHKSLGLELEQRIKELVELEVMGVECVEVSSFRAGKRGVVNVLVVASDDANFADIQHAITLRVDAVLKESELEMARCDVALQSAKPPRRAVVLVKELSFGGFETTDLELATHLYTIEESAYSADLRKCEKIDQSDKLQLIYSKRPQLCYTSKPFELNGVEVITFQGELC